MNKIVVCNPTKCSNILLKVNQLEKGGQKAWRGYEKSSWCVSLVVIRCCFYFRSHSGSDLQTDEA